MATSAYSGVGLYQAVTLLNGADDRASGSS